MGLQADAAHGRVQRPVVLRAGFVGRHRARRERRTDRPRCVRIRAAGDRCVGRAPGGFGGALPWVHS
ncbi:hypothetical protein ACFPRL_36570 [Pseudoclavibacter helvolus]